MKKKAWIVFMAGSLLLAACASGGGTAPSASGLDSIPAEYAGKTNPLGAEAAPVGAEVFKTNCSTCHGEQGHGDGAASAAFDPRPKNLAELQKQAGDDYLFWRISTGKQGTAMVGWKGSLTDGQIWQVVSFLRTLE